MMGPPCAVADVRGDKATIWTGTQGPFRTRDAIAKLLNIPPKNVHLLYREGSGSYGRLESDDVAEDAALMSRAVGKPVRVQWMREDEHAWDPKGPAQLTTVRAGVDAQGNVIAWDFMDRSFPWTESEGNPAAGVESDRHQADRSGILERRRRRRPNLHVRKSESSGGGHSLGAAGPVAAANQQSSRARRSGPRLRQRIVHGRNRRGSSASIRCSSGCATSPATSGISEILRRHGQEGRLDRSGRRPRSLRPANKAAGRGVAVANRANTMTAAVAEIEVDKSTGRCDREENHPGARLRLDRQSRWPEKSDRRKHPAGGEPRAAGRGSVRFHRRKRISIGTATRSSASSRFRTSRSC